LSPVGQLQADQRWHSALELLFKRPGILSPRPTFFASFARACRDCGALIPFLDEEQRRRLDAAADDLADVDTWAEPGSAL
jgi:hypothetical protein